MNSEFSAGDLVQLKSGGPVMTVDRVHHGMEGVTYYCTWFAGAKDNHRGFSEAALKPAEEE